LYQFDNALSSNHIVNMNQFCTLNLAVSFYRACRQLKLPAHLKDQLARASSSIALNLAEGRGKPSIKDQKRYFHIAMGSIRECQTLLVLADLEENQQLVTLLDHLAACTYRPLQRAG
jgi:four helix bundle protein